VRSPLIRSLGNERFEAAVRDGEHLSLEQAVDLAMSAN
jgi:hypothetical protein